MQISGSHRIKKRSYLSIYLLFIFISKKKIKMEYFKVAMIYFQISFIIASSLVAIVDVLEWFRIQIYRHSMKHLFNSLLNFSFLHDFMCKIFFNLEWIHEPAKNVNRCNGREKAQPVQSFTHMKIQSNAFLITFHLYIHAHSHTQSVFWLWTQFNRLVSTHLPHHLQWHA